jgi:S-adenosylmethionine synthetase
MARHIAKNIVAAGLAERCEVQLAYAIGVADPVSILVDTFGTCKVDPHSIPDLVRSHFKLTPKGIIESLNLRRPIYCKTAAYGHFGRSDPDFTWESTAKSAKLAADAGLREPAHAGRK